MKNRKRLRTLLTVVLIAGAGAFGYVGLHSWEKRQYQVSDTAEVQTIQPDETPETIRGTIRYKGTTWAWSDQIESYLLIGTDAGKTGEEHTQTYQGGMADFLMLIVFNRTAHTHRMLFLNRDTMAKITLMLPDGSGIATARQQLCTAHWYGGDEQQSCENTVRAVSDLLYGIPIDGYYSLNMEIIPKLNAAVGGVTVTVEDDFSAVDPSLKQGSTVKLTDAQAYTYVHDRYDVGDETNRSRMKRQLQFISGFRDCVQKLSEEDSGFLVKLYETMQEDAVTDITGKTYSSLIREMNQSKDEGIVQPEGKEKIGVGLADGILHMEVHIEKDSLFDVIKQFYVLKEYKK